MADLMSRSPQEWGNAYRELYPRYGLFSEQVRGLLETLLTHAEIDVVQIEARAKEPDSFVDKVARRPGRYENPLEEVRDLAGARIVAYYLSDVAKIGALIEAEFDVNAEHSWRADVVRDNDRFGYLSDHFVVTCGAERQVLAEWQPFATMCVEIQVRTVLQHAWAAIDHKLEYKRTRDVPSQLRRQLSRVSALLEVADEQFEAARGASEQLDASYGSRTSRGDLDLPIDVASLRAYLTDNSLAERVGTIAAEIGFEVPPADTATGTADIVTAAEAAGLATVTELDEFLHESEWAHTALSALWDARPGGTGWQSPIPFLIATLVWIGSDADLDLVSEKTGADAFYTEALRAARIALAGNDEAGDG
jgi:putative GTP pyrophosphokinase